eukprot:gene19454-biopygen19046
MRYPPQRPGGGIHIQTTELRTLVIAGCGVRPCAPVGAPTLKMTKPPMLGIAVRPRSLLPPTLGASFWERIVARAPALLARVPLWKGRMAELTPWSHGDAAGGALAPGVVL